MAVHHHQPLGATESIKLSDALRPPRPGRLVRATSFLPGSRLTADQIISHARYWQAEAERAVAGGGPVLVALGDSLAQGIGAAEPGDGYVAAVSRALGSGGPLPVVNLSRSGARMANVLYTQLPVLSQLDIKPVAILCTVGSNDLLRSVQLRGQRRLIHELMAALPSTTVVATVPAAGSMAAKAFNRSLRSAAAEQGLIVADVGALLRSWRGRRAGDGFHPNEEGYRLWTEAVLDALAPTV